MITWPLLSNKIRRGSTHNTFGMVRKYENGKPKPHQGWDLYASVGTPVYAIGDGKVVHMNGGGDYGVQFCHSFLHNGHEYYAFYAHLSAVIKNKSVHIDDLIGYSGTTGNATGFKGEDQHLHFEVRKHPHLGTGLLGRISPLIIFGRCPLKHSADGTQMIG